MNVRNLLWLIIFLMLLQAVGGLVFPEIYHDNLFVRSAWKGNDLITLFLAVPMFIGTMLLAGRKSVPAQCLVCGMLAYSIYNYAFYLFGAHFNSHFLIYTLIFGISLYLLPVLFLKSKSDLEKEQIFRSTAGTKIASGFMILCGVFLGTLWIAQSLHFALNGVLPSIILTTEHSTNITAALDLSVVVPGFVVGGISLWRNKPLGYLLGLTMNLKGAIYTLGLAAGSWFAASAGVPGVAEQIPLWISLCAGSVLSLFFLAHSSQPQN